MVPILKKERCTQDLQQFRITRSEAVYILDNISELPKFWNECVIRCLVIHKGEQMLAVVTDSKDLENLTLTLPNIFSIMVPREHRYNVIKKLDGELILKEMTIAVGFLKDKENVLYFEKNDIFN